MLGYVLLNEQGITVAFLFLFHIPLFHQAGQFIFGTLCLPARIACFDHERTHKRPIRANICEVQGDALFFMFFVYVVTVIT